MNTFVREALPGLAMIVALLFLLAFIVKMQAATRQLTGRSPEPLLHAGNAALSSTTFEGITPSEDPMTLAGTINKAALLLALVFAGAAWVWHVGHAVAPDLDRVHLYFAIGTAGGFALALLTIFRRTYSPYTSPFYAILEGFSLGAVALMTEVKWPGVVLQAVGLTFAIFACMLALYRLRIIQPTARFTLAVTGATSAIALVYLCDLVLSGTGYPIKMIHQSGALGIGVSLFVLVVAAFNLVMDFKFIEIGVAQRSPKYMEWYAAFGLVVTLVWIYLEMLRLLSKIKRR